MDEQLDTLLERERLAPAPIGRRVIAFGIDEMLVSVLIIVIFWDALVASQTFESHMALFNAYFFEIMAIKILYHTFFTMQYGASLGKMAMKIRVVELSTLGNPGLASSLNRGVFRAVSEIFFYLGFVWAMIDPYRRGWHDRTARTLVIDA